MTIKEIRNLSRIADKYDIFFVDLWGVIHDGIEAYPGVHKALNKLRDAGKKVIFLSNAPRRISRVVEGLRNLGVQDELYDAVITSGEVCFEHVKNDAAWQGKYIIVGPERDSGLLDGAGCNMVNSVKDADFMVVTGFDNDDSTIEEKQPYLDEAIKLNMPLICANPDLIVVRLSGEIALCAGVVAKKYEEMGGRVVYFGKPHLAVYERCMQLVQNTPKQRIAAIGDSILNDIKGANNFGIDSYFIPGGIAGRELSIAHGQLPDADKLQEFCDNFRAIPTGVLPEFVF